MIQFWTDTEIYFSGNPWFACVWHAADRLEGPAEEIINCLAGKQETALQWEWRYLEKQFGDKVLYNIYNLILWIVYPFSCIKSKKQYSR